MESTNSDLTQGFFEHQAQTSPSPFGIHLTKAEGSLLWDVDGKQYIDFIAGISSANIGHRHPAVLRAIETQSAKFLHTMVYGEYIQESQVELVKKLDAITPDALNSAYLVNSGTESVEAAIKLAKRHTGRHRVIAFNGAYHGNTQGAMSVSSNESKKTAFRPLIPGVQFLDFNELDQLDQIDVQCAAVIIEPVQGDAGVRIASSEFMKKLRHLCDQTGALLIFDEIQSGLGRTGKMFAFEWMNVVPDMLCLAKSLGAGLPIGAMMSSAKIMNSLTYDPPLGHITTFGGNPLSCATALAGLKVLKEEIDLDEVNHKGERLKKGLNHPLIKSVRQIGLMLAVDLENEEQLAKLIEYCKEKGLVMYRFLSHPYSFRISPPLNIESELIDQGIQIILDGLNEMT